MLHGQSRSNPGSLPLLRDPRFLCPRTKVRQEPITRFELTHLDKLIGLMRLFNAPRPANHRRDARFGVLPRFGAVGKPAPEPLSQNFMHALGDVREKQVWVVACSEPQLPSEMSLTRDHIARLTTAHLAHVNRRPRGLHA
jgi:hypothetical protein